MKKILIVGLFLFSSLTAFAAFPDVDGDSEYARAVNFLQERGVISGYPDGSFGPERTLSRAELLKILIEAVGVSDDQLAPYFNQKCFEDVVAGQWFTKYVCYAKDKGFVVGYENGRFFRPAQDVTVVEAIKMTLAVFGYVFSENEGAFWYVGVVNAAADSHLIPPDVSGFNTPMRREQMAELATRAVKDGEGTLDDHLEDSSDRDEPVDFEEIEAREKRFIYYPAVAKFEFQGALIEDVFTLYFVPDERAAELENVSWTYFETAEDYLVAEGESMGVYSDGSYSEEDFVADTFTFNPEDLAIFTEGCTYIDDYDFALYFPEDFGLTFVTARFDLPYFKSLGYVTADTDKIDFVNYNPCSKDFAGDGNGGRQIILQAKDPDAATAQKTLDWLEDYVDRWLADGNPFWSDYNYGIDFFKDISESQVDVDTYNRVHQKFQQMGDLIKANEAFWNSGGSF